MADDSLYDRRTLEEAKAGFAVFSSRLDDLSRGVRPEASNIVKFLRTIPASDTAKKTELAKFFQSEDGERYTREEREELYNDLLGRERNKRTLG